MGMLVKFIAVNNKVQIDDNEGYIYEIYKAINSSGLIKSVNIDPDAASFGAGPIRELDDEGSVFLLEFNSDEEKPNIWSIYFQYGTYDNSKQLEIAIYSDTYVPRADEAYLEKLKLRIKKCISRDWEKIIWLVDKDSECLSTCLYPKIYKIENLMREVINEVMVKQYGTSWWETFASANIKKKHSERLSEYKVKVTSFRDVDERLMSIDIDDLGELVKFKRFKWNPTFSERINAFLNGVQGYNEGAVRDELYKQRVIETDLWAEQFSKYLSEEFNDRYTTFTRDRNHIMHNKLIDRPAFISMKELIEQLETDLVNAVRKVQSEILSNEAKKEIEKQKEAERQMLEEWERECKENDANVLIKDSFEIEELFHENIEILLTGIEDKLRFRRDIEIVIEYLGNGYNGKLFSVKSNVDNSSLEYSYSMSIDESEGADSYIEFWYDNGEAKTYIEYQNGEVEYNEDSGLYMPVIEDSIDDVEVIIDEIVDIINAKLPNYMETVNPEDIAADLVCFECGNESICINEDILPSGTCINCGYVNSIHMCEKCNMWFNSDEDGRIIEDISICQNCLEALEDE